MKNYTSVPNIITNKDLSYIDDIFKSNFLAIKNTYDAISNIEDEELEKHLKKADKLFNTNISNILSYLNEGGYNENN